MRQCPTCREVFAAEVIFCPRDGTDLSAAADSRIGARLEGGIELVGVAGRGAMGTVYEGWQLGMERRVAVKMLHGELSRDETFVARFLNEAIAVARLNHPNIVTVHMVGQHEGRPYIVMEFIEGETVLDHVERAPLSAARTIRIARQVVSALADAHAAHIIHRDLKPSNVLLGQRRRAADFVKILDFGVAKMVDVDSRLTADGFVFGTPAYISPEQANGTAVDHRADLYSLGVMMWEMLAGDLPFHGNQVQLLLAHVKEPPPPLRERAPEVPEELAELIAALMAKHPGDRPPTAEVVADILDHIGGAPAASPWASAVLPEATREALLEAVAASSEPAPSLAEGGELETRPVWVGARSGARAASSASREAAAPRRRRRPGRRLIAAGALVTAVVAIGLAVGLRDRLPAHGLELPEAAPETPAPEPPSPPPGPREIRPEASRQSIMLGQEGYSLRVLRPRRIVAGVEYSIGIDVWDPDGEPIDVDRIPVWFIGPHSEKAPAALPGETRGHFEVRVALEEPGDHQLKILPPGVQQPIAIHFEVAPPGG